MKSDIAEGSQDSGLLLQPIFNNLNFSPQLEWRVFEAHFFNHQSTWSIRGTFPELSVGAEIDLTKSASRTWSAYRCIIHCQGQRMRWLGHVSRMNADRTPRHFSSESYKNVATCSTQTLSQGGKRPAKRKTRILPNHPGFPWIIQGNHG